MWSGVQGQGIQYVLNLAVRIHLEVVLYMYMAFVDDI